MLGRCTNILNFTTKVVGCIPNFLYKTNQIEVSTMKKTISIIALPSFLFAWIMVDQTQAKEIVWKEDGAKMVLIPAGTFEMGDHLGNMVNASPVHRVELSAFYMDIHEVTVGQFKQFVQDSGYDYKRWKDIIKYSPTDDHPIIFVTWYDAVAYAQWAGKRLPTEAEWEYASRGNLAGKLYPWGDDVNHDDANYLSVGGKDKWNKQAAPVGSFAANGFGLLDVAGNVWEWCLDSYDNRFYHKSPRINPISARWSIEEVMKDYVSVTSKRVLRGGSWHSAAGNMRVAYRYNSIPRANTSYLGFRCVVNVD